MLRPTLPSLYHVLVKTGLPKEGYAAARDPALQAIVEYNSAEATDWLYGSLYRSWKRPTQKSSWKIVVG